jgi:hypothetical protein
MKALSIFALGLLVCLLAVSTKALANDIGGPPPTDGAVEVLMGFNLVNITDVNERDETIDFEGAIYLAWMDPRQAYDPTEYGMSPDWSPGDYSTAPRNIYQGDFAVKETFEGWRPHVVIPNGIGNRVVTNMAISIWPDGRVAYSETFFAKAETPMDLRRYPFDTQELEIFFHPFVYHRGEVVLVPDDKLARTWDQNMGIADWTRESVTMAERGICRNCQYISQTDAYAGHHHIPYGTARVPHLVRILDGQRVSLKPRQRNVYRHPECGCVLLCYSRERAGNGLSDVD